MYPEYSYFYGNKRRRLNCHCLLAVVVLLLAAAGVAAQGQTGYRESLIPLSDAELIQRALNKDSYAQHQLATRLAEGRGAIPQNIPQSLFWYERAARNGLRPRFSSAGSSATVDLLPSPALRNHHSVLVSAPASESAPEVVASVSTSEVNPQQSVGFDASQSIGVNGLVVYSWDFGNGETAQGVTASTSYDLPGTYVASVVVLDSTGQIGKDVITITVLAAQDNVPLASFVVDPSDIDDSAFAFLFSSTSTDDQGIESWLWNFDDGGSSIGEIVSHTFETPGVYSVSLSVTDSSGQTVTTSQTLEVIDPVPVASFTVTATSAGLPLTVEVDGSASTDNAELTDFSWDFGNDEAGTGAIASVDYTAAGEYTVALTVTDSAGQTSVTTQTITVSEPDPAPIALFTATPTSGVVPLTVDLDASASTDNGELTGFSWDFGNDEAGTGETTSVEYTTAGEYTVTLTVTDSANQIASQTVNISVEELPPPDAPVVIGPIAGYEREQDDINVRFEWMPVEGAISYDLEITDSQTGVVTAGNHITPTMALCTNSACRFTFSSVDFLSIAPAHIWRVRVRTDGGLSDWAEGQIQIVPVATERLDAPVALFPETDDEIVRGSDVNFIWERDEAAVGYTFVLYDAVLKEFYSTYDLDPDEICNELTCIYTAAVELTVDGRHSWEVRAVNGIGTSNRDRTWFRVIAPSDDIPAVPVAASPLSDTEVLTESLVTFVWSQSLGTETYEFELAGDDGSEFDMVTGLEPITVCASGLCQYATLISLDPSVTYVWRVRARNSFGVSDFRETSLLVVESFSDRPPVAFFSATALVGTEPLLVDFDASDSSDDVGIEFYSWDFGDGTLQEGTDAVLSRHSFDAGEHAVTLTVTDVENQTHSISLTVSVVGNLSPVAAFAIDGFVSDASGLAPFVVELDATASTDDVEIVVYEWDFGDGSASVTTAEPAGVGHVYGNPGEYTVTLTTHDVQAKSDSISRNITVFPEAAGVSSQDAARLLTQATFGPTVADIERVQAMGLEAWIDQQFQMSGPAHLDYVLQHSNGSNRWPRHEIWWSSIVDGEDQLRQRVAFALSQIFVVSDVGRTLSNAQFGVTGFYDQLRDLAFGNYRDLLETVTLSPVMGLYLSMLQNAKADPASNTRADENYAREVLQLFSIGLYELNLDGSSLGQNTFTQDQIESFARVFTGWNYKDADRWEREFFNSPGLSARADLELALDNIFNHQNVGPFIGKQLIQKLVTSNPSDAYVGRVASTFNDNGAGVRGDLRAVVKAILLDAEARSGFSDNNYGKLREPILKLSHLWRAFSITRGNHSSDRAEYNTASPSLDLLEQDFGQAVLRSPSVFNFYHPEYSPSGVVRDAGLVAPVFEILTENNQLNITNRLVSQIMRHYAGNPVVSERNPSYLDFSTELELADNSDELLDHLDLLMLNEMMSADMRTELKNHIDSLPDGALGLSQRVRDTISLIMVSPEYSVQR